MTGASLSIALLLSSWAAAKSEAPADTVRATDVCVVERVVDGDTLKCRGGRRIRLLLIDSPERNQKPFGKEATEQLARLLPNGSLARLEFDVSRLDRYGRTLAYVYDGKGLMANEEMIRSGFAVIAVYPPNVRHVERLRAAAEQARVTKRGLWARNGFECLPSRHRAKRC